LRQVRGDHLVNPVNIYQMGVMSPTSKAGRALVVWDFDWSLINKDSDETLVKGIGAHHIFERLVHGGLHWNKSMDLTLLAAHKDMGVSEQDMLDALMTLPLEKSTKEVIQHLASLDTCDQIILSDANYVSILSVLQQHGIEDCFMDVHTNPAEFHGGALRVSPYHKADHGCTTLKGTACPPNMCKGKVLEGFLLENNYEMVAYVGDGQGDFCACTRLGPRDLIFARTAYPGDPPENCALLKMLKSNGAAIISDEQKSSAFFNSASTGGLQHMLVPNNRVCGERIVSQVVPWSDPDELASCLSKLASCWA